jgi:hypothetical protein
VDLEPDLFAHLAVQGRKDRFAEVDLASRHHPLAAERMDAAPGQQHPLLLIDDAGDDGCFDVTVW